MGEPAKKLKHGEGLKRIYRDLIEATKANDIKEVNKALLDDPTQIRMVDARMMNALHWAVFRNNVIIAKELLEFRYVDKNSQTYVLDADAIDGFGRKPIEIAVKKGNEDMIQLISKVVFPQMFDPNSEWNSDDPPKKIIEFPKPEPE